VKDKNWTSSGNRDIGLEIMKGKGNILVRSTKGSSMATHYRDERKKSTANNVVRKVCQLDGTKKGQKKLKKEVLFILRNSNNNSYLVITKKLKKEMKLQS